MAAMTTFDARILRKWTKAVTRTWHFGDLMQN